MASRYTVIQMNELVPRGFTVLLHESTKKHLHSHANENVRLYLQAVEQQREIIGFNAIVIDYYLTSIDAR
jgi:hypothetical protein